VQQAELHGPARTTCGVSPVEGARKEHVLRADDDCVALGVNVPVTLVFGAHEDVHGDFVRIISARRVLLDLVFRRRVLAGLQRWIERDTAT